MSGVETALVVSALAAGAGAYGNYKAANEADKNAAQGIRMQAQKQQQADAQVNQLLDKTAQSNPAAAQSQIQQQFMQQLAAQRSRSGSSMPVGAASSRYVADSGKAAADTNAYATNLADIMSRIDAPALQRRNEAQTMARAGSDLGLISNAANGDAFLTALKSRNIQPNPWLGAVQQVGGAYANTKAGQGSGKV